MRRLGLGITAAVLASALIVGGMTTAATAGGGSDATTAAGKKKKKKTCPAGTTKTVKKNKKTGKKKVTCTPIPAPVTPAPLGAALSISPTDFNFGGVSQGGLDNCQPDPDPDCPTNVFVVTNSGPGTSGAPTVTITNITTDGNGNGGFEVAATNCTAALAPGATCTVTVRAGDDTNFTYQARLNVSASPGTTASATMEVS